MGTSAIKYADGVDMMSIAISVDGSMLAAHRAYAEHDVGSVVIGVGAMGATTTVAVVASMVVGVRPVLWYKLYDLDGDVDVVTRLGHLHMREGWMWGYAPLLCLVPFCARGKLVQVVGLRVVVCSAVSTFVWYTTVVREGARLLLNCFTRWNVLLTRTWLALDSALRYSVVWVNILVLRLSTVHVLTTCALFLWSTSLVV